MQGFLQRGADAPNTKLCDVRRYKPVVAYVSDSADWVFQIAAADSGVVFCKKRAYQELICTASRDSVSARLLL